MKYGTFKYGQYPYGPFELDAVPGAVGQDKIFRLTPLGNFGLSLGPPLINTHLSIPIETQFLRLRSDKSDPIILQTISLNIEPTKIRIKSDKSEDYLVCEIGTLRSKS